MVDELADLVLQSKSSREQIIRLAQKARAAGIHLVLATQRPSAKLISGLLKANVPGRMAFATTSGVDSRVILDISGAEDLLGRGDMLFQAPWEPEPIRLQGAYVTDSETKAAVARWMPPPSRVASGSSAAAETTQPRPNRNERVFWAVLGFVFVVLLLILFATLTNSAT